MNGRIKKLSDSLLDETAERFEETGQSQRLFCAFWYRADSWLESPAEIESEQSSVPVIVTGAYAATYA